MPQARDNVSSEQLRVSMIAVLGARTGRRGSIIAALGGESRIGMARARVGDGRIMGLHPLSRDRPARAPGNAASCCIIETWKWVGDAGVDEATRLSQSSPSLSHLRSGGG